RHQPHDGLVLLRLGLVLRERRPHRKDDRGGERTRREQHEGLSRKAHSLGSPGRWLVRGRRGEGKSRVLGTRDWTLRSRAYSTLRASAGIGTGAGAVGSCA